MDVENVVRTLLEALEARAQVFERAHAHDAQHNPVMCIHGL